MKAMLLAATVLMSVLGSTAQAVEMKQVGEDRVAAFAGTVDQAVFKIGNLRCSNHSGYRVSDFVSATGMTALLKKANAAYVDESGTAPAIVVGSPTGPLTRKAVGISTDVTHKIVTAIRVETQDLREVNVNEELTNPVMVPQFFTTATDTCVVVQQAK